MELKVIGSSSVGNCYLLVGKEATLVIEAGVRFQFVKKALDFNISNIVGVLVSHIHLDHSKYIKDYLNSGINVYSHQYMKDFFHIENYNYHILEPQKMGDIGPFKVKAIEVVHDAYCYAFLIQHPESGLILFLTDSFYAPYKFPGLSQIIIECNYDDEILDDNIEKGKLPLTVRNRVLNSHMSLNTVKDMLLSNDLSGVNNIVLTHLSDGNSDERKFKDEITKLTGKNVFIADKDMCIDFNKEPF